MIRVRPRWRRLASVQSLWRVYTRVGVTLGARLRLLSTVVYFEEPYRVSRLFRVDCDTLLPMNILLYARVSTKDQTAEN